MKTLSLCIHILSAVVIIINSLVFLAPSLLIALTSALFDGNAIGLIMIALGIAMLVAGITIFRTGLSDAQLIETDVLLYRSNEIRIYLIAAAVFALCLVILLLYNSFSVEEVFKYGFGFFLYIFVPMLIINLVGLALTMTKVH